MQNPQFITDESLTFNELQFSTTEETVSQLDFSNLVLNNEPLENIDVNSIQNHQEEIIKNDHNEIIPHWFYSTIMNSSEIWWPFSLKESELLEKHFKSSWQGEEIIVKKGLYKAVLSCRSMNPIFWTSTMRSKIRRATWYFQADNDTRLLPFSENLSYSLDGYYNQCFTTNQWNVQFQLPSDNFEGHFDTYNFYGPDCLLVHQSYPANEGKIDVRCTISRGLSDAIRKSLEIGSVEPMKNVIFFIQNPLDSLETTLSLCDQFRSLNQDLISKGCIQKDFFNQLEILPIYWTSEETEDYIAEVMNKIRQCSIRNEFDVQSISVKDAKFIETMLFWNKECFNKLFAELKSKINHVVQKWKQIYKRDYDQVKFHCMSIGFSCVLMNEILSGPEKFIITLDDNDVVSEPMMNPAIFQTFDLTSNPSQIKLCSLVDEEPEVKVNLSNKTQPGFPFKFEKVFFIGSELSRYLALNDNRSYSLDDISTNCSRLVNIYNPYDESCSRLETFFSPDWRKPAVKIPRFRHGINLDIKTNLSRVGSDLSTKVFQSLESTFRSFQEFAYSHISKDVKETHEQSSNMSSDNVYKNLEVNRTFEINETEYFIEIFDNSFTANKEMQGQRLDYVLQSASLTSLSQIVFGSQSLETYLKSHDLILFLLRTIKGCDSPAVILNKLSTNLFQSNQ